MVKKPKQQHSDEGLFRQEMADVVPLKTPPTTDSKLPQSPGRRRKTENMSVNFTRPYLLSSDDQTHITADDGSSHRKNGVQKRIMQQLKRGRFPVSEQLDLHNMTIETAQTALLEFITYAQSKTPGVVRIIHGKGLRSENGPRLKLMTRQVLRDHPQVLAFSTCKPADGGTGAVDVLLKSRC